MSNSHRSYFTQLCLIALLLWGQTAVAQHELDHSWHDATELCQVFSSADHAKAALAAVRTVVPDADAKQTTLNIALSVADYRVVTQTARGPPVATTT